MTTTAIPADAFPIYCAGPDCFNRVPSHEILCEQCKATPSTSRFFGTPKFGWPLGVQDTTLPNLTNDFTL